MKTMPPGRALGLLLSLFLPETLQADDIVLGMSAAFRGPSRGLSIELYRGSSAYFEHVNRAGGVHGRSIRIKAYDDGYNPTEAVSNTMRLVEKDKVFLLFDYMGTPTVTRVLPLLKKYESQSVYLFFPFTGAEPHRRYPYDQFVFNLRASYHQETAYLVDRLVEAGRRKIAVFYQIDAYGRNGWDGVRKQLATHDLQIVAEATYPRGTPYMQSMARQVEILRAAGPDAIIAIATYSSCAAFVRDARDAGWADVPIANVSGVDSDNLLELLQERGKETGKDYTANLINSQVVPSYLDNTLEGARQYRKFMDLYKPMPPRALLDEDYHAPRHSFISFEGYLNARLLVAILEKMGPDPQRQRIKAAVESIKMLELGIDVPVTYGAGHHQGLDRVYCTVISAGKLVPLDDAGWQRWRK